MIEPLHADKPAIFGHLVTTESGWFQVLHSVWTKLERGTDNSDCQRENPKPQ